MPPQSVEIAGTIAALKRTLRREKEAPSDQPISSATNRYNKLKRGALYVHAGALPYAYTSGHLKQKVEHAGYMRYILERNPKRYNEYGDELEDSESDVEADADADDENAYNGIRLEELLCPLKHPAELATHPTLSLPFLDSALPDMVKSTEAKLREERANLWRAKNLNRRFIGDESWVPCGSVEADGDWDLFAPAVMDVRQKPTRKRKRGAERHDTPISATTGPNGVDMKDRPEIRNKLKDQKLAISVESIQETSWQTPDDEGGSDTNQQGADHAQEDILMANGGTGKQIVEDDNFTDEKDLKQKDLDEDGEALLQANIQKDQRSDTNQSSRSTTPPAPTRRITRALAAENDASTAATPPALSPTTTSTSLSSSLLQPDPLFLLPSHLSSSSSSSQTLSLMGLPIEEILETRRLITMYIQKQEESIRGYEAVLGKLIKAKRMRDNVWEWSKAEGHVGEWSDGEDWVDGEAWGVAPGELRKGKDEDEVNNEDGNEVVVGAHGGGRKGKRRRVRE